MITIKKCESDKKNILFVDEEMSLIKNFLLENVDWDLVFSVMVSLKRTFNSGSETFVKADIICKAIEESSNNKIVYINEIGCDFYIPELDIKMEMKSGQSIFSNKKKKTAAIKIKNLRGLKNLEDIKLKKTFDFMLLLEPDRSAIITFANVTKELKIYSDGIGTKANISDLEIVKEVYSIKNTNISLTNRYEEMIKSTINDVRIGLYGESI